ncbi:MAG: glycosyltransferase [Bacteroidales bacterium]|nr:glycosyltransferase [Bacteroidales bacterium]
MHNPKISIITITYNSEKTLEETVQSVISQDYPNLEYLIIDGGSKDRTLDIVEKYRDKISFVISEPDRGISDAFNKGIRYATGEIVGIINSDDLLLPGALKTLAENYDPEVGVYRGNTIIWNDETDTKIVARPTMTFSIYSFKRRIVCHQSTFVTKKAYEAVGTFKESFKYMMDSDLLFRLYNNDIVFRYIPSDLAVFRMGGVTNNSFWKKRTEVRRLYRENGASRLWASIRVVHFLIYSFTAVILRKVFSPDIIRRWKFNSKKNA